MSSTLRKIAKRHRKTNEIRLLASMHTRARREGREQEFFNDLQLVNDKPTHVRFQFLSKRGWLAAPEQT